MTRNETDLEDVFAKMRTDDVVPSEALLNKIMQDADSVLAQNNPAVPRPKQSVFAALMDAIGGWPSFSGLAAATVAGVWIGVSPPDALADMSVGLWGDTIEVPILEIDLFAGLEG